MPATPVELVRLESWGTGFSVRIIERDGPGIPSVHDLLVAEIAVWSEFVSGSVRHVFLPEDLDEWARVIDRLEAAESTPWLAESGRTVEVRFACEDLPSSLTVRVDDPIGASAAAEVVVDVEDGWIDDLRVRLDEARRTFPRETRQTSPGVWVWDRDQD